MARTLLSVAAAAISAAAVGFLLWPTSRCVSTLIGVPAGQPDPNRRTCVSVIGLPASRVVAVVVAMAVAAMVYAWLRPRRT